jgi:hypothetical protein
MILQQMFNSSPGLEKRNLKGLKIWDNAENMFQNERQLHAHSEVCIYNNDRHCRKVRILLSRLAPCDTVASPVGKHGGSKSLGERVAGS